MSFNYYLSGDLILSFDLELVMIEIERKFLVKSDAYKDEAFQETRIVQGFLNTHKDRTVRVRVKGDLGFITVKGLSSKNGLSRFEWEKEITIRYKSRKPYF